MLDIVEKVVRVPKHRVCDIDIEIGHKLQEFRETFCITQTELGKAIGVTFQQIQKYEKGTNRIHAEVIWKIASTFSVDVDFFFATSEQQDHDGQNKNNVGFSLNNIKYSDKESIKLIKYYMQIKDANVKKKILNLILSIIDIEDKV